MRVFRRSGTLAMSKLLADKAQKALSQDLT